MQELTAGSDCIVGSDTFRTKVVKDMPRSVLVCVPCGGRNSGSERQRPAEGPVASADRVFDMEEQGETLRSARLKFRKSDRSVLQAACILDPVAPRSSQHKPRECSFPPSGLLPQSIMSAPSATDSQERVTPPIRSTPTASATSDPREASAFESWRSSLSQLTGLGLTPEEAVAREARLKAEREAGDWTHCEKWKNSLMTRSL